jgi:hypothetical protein
VTFFVPAAGSPVLTINSYSQTPEIPQTQKISQTKKIHKNAYLEVRNERNNRINCNSCQQTETHTTQQENHQVEMTSEKAFVRVEYQHDCPNDLKLKRVSADLAKIQIKKEFSVVN